MTTEEIIKQLEDLKTTITTQRYFSHYTAEKLLDSLLQKVDKDELDANPSLANRYQEVITATREQINELKTKNERLIKTLDFVQTGIDLINDNDKTNLSGLIDIGHYFGTGPRGQDVCVDLDKIYDYFKCSPSTRVAGNIESLNYLADRLHLPRLLIPQKDFRMFQNPRDKLLAIIKADDVLELMRFIPSATQDELDFSLRAAVALDPSSRTLLFLLLRTKSDTEMCKINLIAQGQPSGQTALHRAVASGKTMTVTIMLDSTYNPSADLLKQFLICDRNGETPIDFIKKVPCEIERSRMATRFQTALEKYQGIPCYSLPEESVQTISAKLEEIKADAERSYVLRSMSST